MTTIEYVLLMWDWSILHAVAGLLLAISCCYGTSIVYILLMQDYLGYMLLFWAVLQIHKIFLWTIILGSISWFYGLDTDPTYTLGIIDYWLEQFFSNITVHYWSDVLTKASNATGDQREEIYVRTEDFRIFNLLTWYSED
jgi:hypothetical protein